MGGSGRRRCIIENLMHICEDCENDYADKTDYRWELYKIHFMQLRNRGIPYNVHNLLTIASFPRDWVNTLPQY